MEDCYKKGMDLVAGGQSLGKAAQQVGVSKTALWRRVQGLCEVSARNGPKRTLNDDEERAMVDACIHMAAAGFGLTVPLLAERVLLICSDGRRVPWGSNGPGRAWVEGFFARWKGTLSVRSCRIYDTNRRAADDPEEARQYFERVRKVLEEHNFPDSHIWNFDETGV